ncbi:MAG TPA: ATP-binding protein [Kofleriaceae bacterium]|nr:ATP-binding protein [Kofleriaceae bacterium]
MRTLWAALLCAAALAAVLGGWFATGWRSVSAEASGLVAAPRDEAARRAALLAAELGARLEELRSSESQRPYYEYQNLFHDPRGASEGQSVVLSPLARGPSDALIAVHFQIAPDGRVTVPTINEDVPELSDAARLRADQPILASLRAHAAELRPLALAPAGALASRWATRGERALAVADAAVPTARAPSPATIPAQRPTPPGPADQAGQQNAIEAPQVQGIEPSAYAQNMAPNQVYRDVQQQRAQPRALPRPSKRPAERPAERPDGSRDPETASVPPPARDAPPGVVEVEVGPFIWRAIELDGRPALVALRAIETPDGRLTQGFTLAPAAVADWLEEHAGDLEAMLTPDVPGHAATAASVGTAAAAPSSSASASPPISLTGFGGAATSTDLDQPSGPPAPSPAWRIAVDPGPALATARAAAAEVRRGFLWSFFPAAALALLCGALVVALVARADRLARERSDFAAAAAHELRTPLAGLVLYGDMLAEGLGDPERRSDYARRVSDEAARLGRVVGNVLGFTQLERRGLALSPRRGDAAQAARDAAERIRPAYAHAGATLSADIADAAPCRFDADAVARILQNLLDNAEKYSRGAADRAVELSVRCDADGCGAVIEIADRGPGVPPHLERLLFRPFARGVDGATSADRAADPSPGHDLDRQAGPAGLGLGLALARAQARAMGGDLAYRDRDGGGAVFSLRLPPAGD